MWPIWEFVWGGNTTNVRTVLLRPIGLSLSLIRRFLSSMNSKSKPIGEVWVFVPNISQGLSVLVGTETTPENYASV
jgi:hypothetical protein